MRDISKYCRTMLVTKLINRMDISKSILCYKIRKLYTLNSGLFRSKMNTQISHKTTCTMLTNPWKSYSYVLQQIPIQRQTPGTAKTLCLISADGKNMISLWGDFDERQNFQNEEQKRNLNKLNVSKWKDFYMQIIKIYELICVSIATTVVWF